MTSPKAISKSFTHYARRHPALGLHVIRFSQLPGRFTPSHDVRKGTESAFRSKKWLLPMLLRWHELVLFAGSYAQTGRFNPECERAATREMRARFSAITQVQVRYRCNQHCKWLH